MAANQNSPARPSTIVAVRRALGRAHRTSVALATALVVTACGGAEGGGGGATDALLYVQPGGREPLLYDVASEQITERHVTSSMEEAVGIGFCDDHRFAVQPMTPGVMTETGQCGGYDENSYWNLSKVVVRNGDGTVRNVFGIPGVHYGPTRISPDGRLLAVRGRTPSYREGGSGEGDPAIFITNVDGDLLATLPLGVADVRWFDDDRLVFVNPEEETQTRVGFTVLSPTVEGVAEQNYRADNVITMASDGRGFINKFDIAPDGRRVVFAWREVIERDPLVVRDEVYTLDLQTNEAHLVAATPDYEAGDNVNGLIGVYGIRQVIWSPTSDSAYVYMGGRSSQLATDTSGRLLKLETNRDEVIRIVSTGEIPSTDTTLDGFGPRLPLLEPAQGMTVLDHPLVPTVSGPGNFAITDYCAVPRSNVPAR